MSHKAIRTLIEETAKSLQDDIDYTYGIDTDFNQKEKRAFSFINTSLLSAVPAYRSNNDTTNYMKQWRVEMAFVKIDDTDSPPEKYAAILDEMDILVDTFINRLNFFTPLSGTFLIQSISQNPVVKVMADILTGYSVSFQMLVSDNFEYCEDCP